LTGLVLVLVGRTLGFGLETLAGGLLFPVCVAMIWKTTRNYFLLKRAAVTPTDDLTE
jgi:hypothetical protein